MENELQNIFIFNLSTETAIANLLVALACGVIISLFYRATYRGVSFSSAHVLSIVMLCMVTALVIMVIGNNLARAFGLVGAMSIIRFRTSVKHTQDIMYIFFALAAGLACGAGMYSIGLIGTLVIGFAMLVASEIYTENPRKKEYLLQLLFAGEQGEEHPLNKTMEAYCKKNKLVNVKTVNEDDALLELSYYVVLKKEQSAQKLAVELKKTIGVKKVNLFFDEN